MVLIADLMNGEVFGACGELLCIGLGQVRDTFPEHRSLPAGGGVVGAMGGACSPCRRTQASCRRGADWELPHACPLLLQGQPGNLRKRWSLAVPAVTQPLPWMSLLCCVNNAGEHFWEHEKPSLEAHPWGWGRHRGERPICKHLGGGT